MSDPIVMRLEKAHLEATLRNLRPHFLGEPDVEILAKVLRVDTEECSPETVLAYARKVKKFSTADVMQHFSVSKYKVAGSLAALRGNGDIRPDDDQEEDENGYSCWKINRT